MHLSKLVRCFKPALLPEPRPAIGALSAQSDRVEVMGKTAECEMCMYATSAN